MSVVYSVTDGKDGDDYDHMDMWCFHERKTELGRRIGMETIGDIMRRCQQMWHEHVKRKGDGVWLRACLKLVVERKAPVDEPWQNAACWHVSTGAVGVDPRETYRSVSNGGPRQTQPFLVHHLVTMMRARLLTMLSQCTACFTNLPMLTSFSLKLSM